MLHKIQSFFHSSIHQLKFLCILLVLPCLALQCNKDNDDPDPDNGNGNNKEQLPPATQSGENTFGCLVNGEVWRPKDDGFYSNKLSGSYGTGSLLVIGKKKLSKNDYKLTDFISIGAFIGYSENLKEKYTNKESKVHLKFTRRKNREECIYKVDSTDYGYISIGCLDTIENIVSGRFEFTAVNDSCGDVDTIRVTKGRFDIKYAH